MRFRPQPRETDFTPIDGTVHSIFPTFFFKGKMNLNHDEVANDVRTIVNKIKEKDNDSKSNYTSYFDYETQFKFLEGNKWYESLTTQLKDTYVKLLHSAIGLKVSEWSRHDIHCFAWVNQYLEGNQHTVHHHKNAFISGTYYVKCDEKSSPIRFINPNYNQEFYYANNDEEIYVEEEEGLGFAGSGSHARHEMQFRPKTGDVLFWPSNMLHYVSPQREGERISISFNLSHPRLYSLENIESDLSYEFIK
tara:strand:- start:149 stop:895 length:747 start_codon:yes stop_codon:yes gene_type:complete